jgi:signal transduction histidine kinase
MIDACALCEIVCDEDGIPIDYIFLNVNDAFEKATGLKIHNVLGKPVTEALPGIESYWIQIYGRVALTGEGVHFENYSQSLNKYFEVTAFATGYHQFAIVFADITDKKLLEQRKTELEIEKSKNNLLSTVLANLSHDFRTPISIINTSLYLIERLDDPNKRSEKIKQIKSQAELFERFIKDVIAILNLEYTNSTNKTNVNVNDILKDVANVFTRRMQKNGQTLNMNIDFNIPDIQANPNQMAQAFNCLVENAVNFTDDGGLINISTNMKDGDIHVIVEDSGIGIDSEELPKIFDKFYRIDKARSHKSGGLGLGLSIVKKVMELHNFKINVISVRNKGTKFDVTIPGSAISKRKSINIPSYVDRVIESAKIKENVDKVTS